MIEIMIKGHKCILQKINVFDDMLKEKPKILKVFFRLENAIKYANKNNIKIDRIIYKEK